MHRRAFLSLSAISPLTHLLPGFARESTVRQSSARDLKTDLVVIGGGVGGIAAALAGARNGLKVILTEEFPWIGGQLTSQGVPPDEHPWIEEQGSTKTYRTFRQRVRDFYLRNYPLTDEAKKKRLLNPGNGNVSRLCHEPRVAVAVLLEMLAADLTAGRILLLQPYRLLSTEMEGDRIAAVEVSRGAEGRRITLEAPFFVDATEMGELIYHTRAEHVTGAEAREDTKEPHAQLDADPDNHQAFTYCFAMDYQDGKDKSDCRTALVTKLGANTSRKTGTAVAWEPSLNGDERPNHPENQTCGFQPDGFTTHGVDEPVDVSAHFGQITSRGRFGRERYLSGELAAERLLARQPLQRCGMGQA